MPFGLPTVGNARSGGLSLGDTYPTIWDPNDVIAERLDHAIAAWLEKQPRRRSPAQRVWITLLTLCAVVAIGGPLAVYGLVWTSTETDWGVDVPSLTAELATSIGVAWLGVMAAVIVCIMGNAMSRRRGNTVRADELRMLHRIAVDAAFERIDGLREKARTYGPLPPAPSRQPFGVSRRGTAELATAWLAHLGCAPSLLDARTNGVDIECDDGVARVVDEDEDAAAAVRELAGVVAARQIGLGVLVLSDKVDRSVVDFAHRTGIAVLVMNPREGSIAAPNDIGTGLLARGAAPLTPASR